MNRLTLRAREFCALTVSTSSARRILCRHSVSACQCGQVAALAAVPPLPPSPIPETRRKAVETVRKWHLTILHDLCLPDVWVIVRSQHPQGLAGQAFYTRTQHQAGWFGVNIDGFILASPVGGGVSVSCHVEIYTAPHFTEPDYIRTLAHELRHIWQYHNNIAPTEEDCILYADRFISRFNAPDFGVCRYVVDEVEQMDARQRIEAGRMKQFADEREATRRKREEWANRFKRVLSGFITLPKKSVSFAMQTTAQQTRCFSTTAHVKLKFSSRAAR